MFTKWWLKRTGWWPSIFFLLSLTEKLKVSFWRGHGKEDHYEYFNFFGVVFVIILNFIEVDFHNNKIIKGQVLEKKLINRNSKWNETIIISLETRFKDESIGTKSNE